MARNILLTLEFDGSAFHGWQVQPGQRTVQGDLESVLREMVQTPDLRVTGSGRTDAGVHALGMNATFFTAHPIPLKGLVRGLNSQLASDIVVLSAREVPVNFCARRNSKGKLYRYRIWNSIRRPAIERNRTFHVYEGTLDLEAMAKGAERLLGRHDFTTFRASGCTSKHPTRDIWDVSIFRRGIEVMIEVEGSAFLRHMVRNIVGSLVEVGKGRQSPEWIAEILSARDRKYAANTAPAQGLYLVYVKYDLPPEEIMPSSEVG